MKQAEIRRATYAEIEQLRDLYRHELGCQIIRDSFPARGLADPYQILLGERLVGYGAVGNKYYPNRLIEFYLAPTVRAHARDFCRALIEASGATELEAQTNSPLMLLLLYDFGQNITAEHVLFADAGATSLPCPDGAVFRARQPEDTGPEGDWVLESEGQVAAAGGYLTHYNPPYGDIYMEVAEPFRRRGYGSYLVQEVKRVCYAGGRKPAARCNPDNDASRRTLEAAGLHACGRLLSGAIKGG